MTNKALEKINAEMQKDPQNVYMEAVGHYVLDRVAMSPEDAEKILAEDKSLKGCLEEIKKKAQKEAKGGVAVIRDDVVFGWADEYFGIGKNDAAVQIARGAASGTPFPAAPALSIDFNDFL